MGIWIYRFNKIHKDALAVQNLLDFLKRRLILQREIATRTFEAGAHSFVLFDIGQRNRLISFDKSGVAGFSGIPIDKSSFNIPTGSLLALASNRIQEFGGAFSFFRITEDVFECISGGMAFHKVFFRETETEIVVSNFIELIAFYQSIPVNRKALLKTYFINKKGIKLGPLTPFDGIEILPESSKLSVVMGKLNFMETNLVESLFDDNSFTKHFEGTIEYFSNIATYFSKHFKTYVTFSGGFDSRVNFAIYSKAPQTVESITYNRQSSMDFLIAKQLARKFGFKANFVYLDPEQLGRVGKTPEFGNPTHDPFTREFIKSLSSIIYKGTIPSVVVNGNGGDTDWVYKLNHLSKSKCASFSEYLERVCEWMTSDSVLSKNFKSEIYSDLYSYLWKKYSFLSEHKEFVKLFNSAFFHIERSITWFGYNAQFTYPYYQDFGPFKEAEFLKLAFAASSAQLDRRKRIGLHYLLYERLTDGKMPYAPIIRPNDWNDSIVKRSVDRAFYFWAKASWKLFGGDTNTQIRRQFNVELNKRQNAWLGEHGAEFADFFTVPLRDLAYDKVPLLAMAELTDFARNKAG